MYNATNAQQAACFGESLANTPSLRTLSDHQREGIAQAFALALTDEIGTMALLTGLIDLNYQDAIEARRM